MENVKARTIITTDGEVDDMNSFLRYLLYSNEVDTEGIILTSSVYHYAGNSDKGIEPFRWTGETWIPEFIDSYGDVYNNLKVHDENYPTPEYLKSIYHIGNITNKGEMEEETEGSIFLENYLLNDKDERILYIQTWGGTNTTARALKSLEEKYSQQAIWETLKKRIEDKVVIYIILNQDETYSDYIAMNWNIKVVNDKFNFWHFAYLWKFVNKNLTTRLSSEWNHDLKMNYSDFLNKYALMADGNILEGELAEEQRGDENYIKNNPEYKPFEFISEGDSPSFFYLFNNGLRNSEDPTFGGWGGRFKKENENLYTNDALDYNPFSMQYESEYTLTRWFDDIQDDFKVRASWTTTDNFDDATHYPIISVNGDLDRNVLAGEIVNISTSAKDSNGKKLYYKWWYYFEASTYSKLELLESKYQDIEGFLIGQNAKFVNESKSIVKLEGENTSDLICYIPEDIKHNETIHLILEVSNEGPNSLKSYKRIILTAKDEK